MGRIEQIDWLGMRDDGMRKSKRAMSGLIRPGDRPGFVCNKKLTSLLAALMTCLVTEPILLFQRL